MNEAEIKMKSNAVVAVQQLDGGLYFTVKGCGKFFFDPAKASAENRARAMIHGFKQRISDGAALARDTETGESASPEAKFARMNQIADHYMSGGTDWELRVAAPKGEAEGTWLCKALVALGKAPTVEEAEALVVRFAEKKHGAQMGPARKALMSAHDIKAKVLELKAAAVPESKLDADEMLADLG